MDFEKCTSSLAVNFFDTTQFQAPSINPNNPDELVFLYTNVNKPQLSGLYSFSILTSSKKQLTSGLKILNQPKFGKNGWVLINVVNGDYREIWKIKSNGDSLTKITSNYPDLYPEWNSDATKIIFNRQIYLGSPSSKILIADPQGTILDSITNQYFFDGAIDKNDELVFPPYSKRNYGITTVNLVTKAETKLYEPNDPYSPIIQGIACHPNAEDFYFTTYYNGLYKINKVSKVVSLIKSFCDTKAYGFISFSPDGTFLLAERIDGRLENCNPHFKSSIYKLSLDGKNETKINME
ncbi:MAG: hypothetical protein ACXVDV_18645 [Bacteroidia bacterium]